ncbi:hypothetical protein OSTOST_24122 [Ostertagia ostertagi]
MDLESRLRAAEQQLRELVQALPPLPSAAELHDKIVQYCIDFHDCTKAVTSLENRVNELRVSYDSLTNRIHQAEYLELQSDHLRLRVLFTLTQLRNLFDLCPILMATRRVREKEWATLINGPHNTSNNEPLLMNLSETEVVATEQLSRIAEIQSKVRNLRRSYHYEYYQSRACFADDKPSTMELQQMVTESCEEVLECRNEQPERKPMDEGAVDSMQYEEDLINERLEQMKPDPDEEDTGNLPNVEMNTELDEEEPLLELVEDEEYELESNLENNASLLGVKREVEDEADEGVPPNRPEDDFVNNETKPEECAETAFRGTSDDRLSRIKAEIQSAEQKLLQLDEITRQLEHEPTCPSRNSDRGKIRRPKGRSMRCVFCGTVGLHYSNSCARVTTARERRVLVLANGRCKYCLERRCKEEKMIRASITIRGVSTATRKATILRFVSCLNGATRSGGELL